MKKAIAILTVLVMILTCCAAFAETSLANLNFTVEDFKTFFSLLADGNGLAYEWAEEPLYTFDYPMYYATNEAQNVFVVIHAPDGIIGIETDVFTTTADLQDVEFGTEYVTVMIGAAYSAFDLQHPESTESDIRAATANITELLNNLDNVDVEGVPTAYTMDLCDDLVINLEWQIQGEDIAVFCTVIAK